MYQQKRCDLQCHHEHVCEQAKLMNDKKQGFIIMCEGHAGRRLRTNEGMMQLLLESDVSALELGKCKHGIILGEHGAFLITNVNDIKLAIEDANQTTQKRRPNPTKDGVQGDRVWKPLIN